jgi:hypothetical protein
MFRPSAAIFKRSLPLKVFTKYNQNDQGNEDEMAMACSMHRREEKCLQVFGKKGRRKETTRKTL